MSITIPDPGPANVEFEQPADAERLAARGGGDVRARLPPADRRER